MDSTMQARMSDRLRPHRWQALSLATEPAGQADGASSDGVLLVLMHVGQTWPGQGLALHAPCS